MKKNIKWIISIICIILFLIIGLHIIEIDNNIVDKTIYNLIITSNFIIFSLIFLSQFRKSVNLYQLQYLYTALYHITSNQYKTHKVFQFILSEQKN